MVKKGWEVVGRGEDLMVEGFLLWHMFRVVKLRRFGGLYCGDSEEL